MTTKKNKPCPFCGFTNHAESNLGYVECTCGCSMPIEMWNHRPLEQKLKDAIQKMLNGIEFVLDENVSRKTASARVKECKKEAIKILTG